MEAGATKQGQAAIILVVERDPHVRELQEFFLHRAGFDVHFAEDGEQALDRTRELRPDIIITEILVPSLDGLALCRRLKQDPETREMLVVVFSILSAAARASEAGADAFLRKPLAERRLLATVEELLTRNGRTVPEGVRDGRRPGREGSDRKVMVE